MKYFSEISEACSKTKKKNTKIKKYVFHAQHTLKRAHEFTNSHKSITTYDIATRKHKLTIIVVLCDSSFVCDFPSSPFHTKGYTYRQHISYTYRFM